LTIAGLNGAGVHGGAPAAPSESTAAAEALSALTNLGYPAAQASSAIAAASKELGEAADTAKLIRRGLKELAR
jgi:Holliday junction DNA helicase RuvA